jgi:transcriptional regulator with XRE-family HTH domain
MSREEQIIAISNNIRKYLEVYKMSQKELAEKIGIKPSTLSDYLNCRAVPSHGVIQKIADEFKVGKSDIDTTYKSLNHLNSDEPTMIAAHKDGENWSEEELYLIEQFKAALRMGRK